MSISGKNVNLQSSLADYNSSDPYQESAYLINQLKQEETPHQSEGSHEDDEDNDRFLEELEHENLMLEKELESLMQLKSSQQKENQQISVYSKEHSPSSERGRNLEKIEEKVEEERESYYYSNSDDEHSVNKTKRKNPQLKESEIQPSELGSVFGVSNMNFENSEADSHFKFKHNDDDEGCDTQRDKNQSSPLRASHLAKSNESGRYDFKIDKLRNQNQNQRLSAKNSNKENVETSEHDLSSSELSTKRRSTRGSHKRSNSKSNKSPPLYEKMDKVSSLEARLSGATKTIKALESEVKTKNEKILELGREIEKKNKLLESHQSSSIAGSQLQKSSQIKESLTTMMRKKEKDLEKKLKDQEIMLTENKKYMARLQELNSKLLTKVKELEDENLFLKTNEDTSSKLQAYEDENKRLKEKVKNMEKENSRLVERCDEQEGRIRNMVEMYDNFERKSEKFIQKNRSMTDTLLSLINLHTDWSNNDMKQAEESVN